ncbi:hypothetical protein Aaci_2032 [Alicyclobacillus acidocaldarius subsp. acidocaldarius DSM 446]|uniref:Uncharacterized protein n=1 Tax=Alicyclobacillus acidocaldarius subsp. acidocaldarius (strain ATCC 27009 / DSM 446 / BCRC 14685 / JCM 5260 / KCTC 1825 / NBRC 15652 / NCIMB 11725 / NRRL B-14509 / 104-IA) TaxID=521098 RepID=C8WQ99_ALIAD|nr:hypothetical protein Aaci_2032 [Alicyclobacillus acidocaldarius subsp. acidocaldarius DSM 446]
MTEIHYLPLPVIRVTVGADGERAKWPWAPWMSPALFPTSKRNEVIVMLTKWKRVAGNWLAAAVAMGALISPTASWANTAQNGASSSSTSNATASANATSNATNPSSGDTNYFERNAFIVWNGAVSPWRPTTLPCLSFHMNELQESDWIQIQAMMGVLGKKFGVSYTMRGNELHLSMPSRLRSGATTVHVSGSENGNSNVVVTVNGRRFAVTPSFATGASASPSDTFIPAAFWVRLLNAIRGCHADLVMRNEIDLDVGTALSSSPKVISYDAGLSASNAGERFTLRIAPSLFKSWASGMHMWSQVVVEDNDLPKPSKAQIQFVSSHLNGLITNIHVWRSGDKDYLSLPYESTKSPWTVSARNGAWYTNQFQLDQVQVSWDGGKSWTQLGEEGLAEGYERPAVPAKANVVILRLPKTGQMTVELDAYGFLVARFILWIGADDILRIGGM